MTIAAFSSSHEDAADDAEQHEGKFVRGLVTAFFISSAGWASVFYVLVRLLR